MKDMREISFTLSHTYPAMFCNRGGAYIIVSTCSSFIRKMFPEVGEPLIPEKLDVLASKMRERVSFYFDNFLIILVMFCFGNFLFW